MMQSLLGRLSASDSDMVDTKTTLRFKDKSQFKTPEALVIHEQKLLSDDRLFEACQIEYNCILYQPAPTYIPADFLKEFEGLNVVVLDKIDSERTVVLGTIPEFRSVHKKLHSDYYVYKIKLIPIYTYVEIYSRQYGNPDFLSDLPVKDKWDYIVQEGLGMNASEVTISSNSKGAHVYYNVRKRLVDSKRYISKEDVPEIINLLAASAKATLAVEDAAPRYFAIDVNSMYRGRCVINKTYHGMMMTIRFLSNALHDKTLEDLNVAESTREFIRATMLSQEKGLRLFIGETFSGKNTTIISALMELVKLHRFKIVSIEQPVEILVDGIEQINAETDEEFELNADSLLRQNPDIVYFTEITARTARAVMQQSNTSKAVFSTIHANSIADVLFRLQDITQMPLDRLVLTLHSCVYQELVRDERTDTIKPYNRCVYFSEDLKSALYGKPMAEIIGVLRGEEMRWK